MNNPHKSLVEELRELNVIKISDKPFILKSGQESSIYVDFRILFSYPATLERVVDAIWNILKLEVGEYDLICGVPYGALPYASGLSMKYKVPMIMCRDAPKSYGLSREIEGIFVEGQRVVIIEDVITTGRSAIEIGKKCRAAGLILVGIIAILDRRSAEEEGLNEAIRVYSVLTIDQLYPSPAGMSFQERSLVTHSSLVKKLFQLMDKKSTNLAVAADVFNVEELFKLIEQVGQHICMLKIHHDIITGFDEIAQRKLCHYADQYEFLICEDSKMADIGKINVRKYRRLSTWADFITAHVLIGASSLEELECAIISKNAKNAKKAEILLISEMSHVDSDKYLGDRTIDANALSQEFHCVAGFICQNVCSSAHKNNGLIYCTPGIHFDSSIKGDSTGQTYRTPQEAISQGSDIVIVGKSILENIDKIQEYQDICWAQKN
jgi:uridine monophosphate synthetase